MPYDHKTELLWNYIGIAQFTDLFRIWGQGPALTNDEAFDSQFQTKSSPVHIDLGVREGMAGRMPPSDATLPVGGGSGISAQFSTHTHVETLPMKVAASGSYGGGEYSAGYSSGYNLPVQLIVRDQEPDSRATNPVSLNPDTNEESEPKIYGPSEVHMDATIISGDNIQSSTVVAIGDNGIHGWSDLGTDTIGSLIDQMTAPEADNPYTLVIDYVGGDLTSLTTLTQLNTIYDNDINKNITSVTAGSHSVIGNASVTQVIESGGNSSSNTATLVGNQTLDGYDVLVVTGDMTKINKIMQVNLVVDEDRNSTVAQADVTMPYGSASSVWDAAIKSGGNIEVNIGFIIDQQTGSVYLVGGFYGSTNAVTQLNILSDVDLNQILQLFHSQEGTGFLGFDASGLIDSGSNSQINQAGFIGEDGQAGPAGMPLSDLTTVLAFAGLHPEDGDIRVLFVDGDYTITNLVVQINVIHDSDSNTQIITAEGAMGSLTPPAEEEVVDPAAGAAEDGTGTALDDAAEDTQEQSGAGGTDDSLPVYADHGSLNYDQVTVSGGNEAGNYAILVDGGNGPLIQIVMGNYTEYNEVYQLNVLLDSDHNRILDSMNSGNHAGSSDNAVQDTAHLTSASDILHKMMT